MSSWSCRAFSLFGLYYFFILCSHSAITSASIVPLPFTNCNNFLFAQTKRKIAGILHRFQVNCLDSNCAVHRFYVLCWSLNLGDFLRLVSSGLTQFIVVCSMRAFLCVLPRVFLANHANCAWANNDSLILYRAELGIAWCCRSMALNWDF